ncbi:hypothetical protein CALVIDRAFT_536010 [Calocera viscosa TUFC12733]|uniref:Uncharacterized protein n=1 Tax=Calocera viscosa (strain TUFC12733) TaxID=1330018 RepID=A0A167NP09_CALVF|nr:hypothetical protein CALVIDRAFT_536010 [Calocera viscosa TUFC12733]
MLVSPVRSWLCCISLQVRCSTSPRLYMETSASWTVSMCSLDCPNRSLITGSLAHKGRLRHTRPSPGCDGSRQHSNVCAESVWLLDQQTMQSAHSSELRELLNLAMQLGSSKVALRLSLSGLPGHIGRGRPGTSTPQRKGRQPITRSSQPYGATSC